MKINKNIEIDELIGQLLSSDKFGELVDKIAKQAVFRIKDLDRGDKSIRKSPTDGQYHPGSQPETKKNNDQDKTEVMNKNLRSQDPVSKAQKHKIGKINMQAVMKRDTSKTADLSLKFKYFTKNETDSNTKQKINTQVQHKEVHSRPMVLRNFGKQLSEESKAISGSSQDVTDTSHEHNIIEDKSFNRNKSLVQGEISAEHSDYNISPEKQEVKLNVKNAYHEKDKKNKSGKYNHSNIRTHLRTKEDSGSVSEFDAENESKQDVSQRSDNEISSINDTDTQTISKEDVKVKSKKKSSKRHDLEENQMPEVSFTKDIPAVSEGSNGNKENKVTKDANQQFKAEAEATENKKSKKILHKEGDKWFTFDSSSSSDYKEYHEEFKRTRVGINK